MLRAGEVDRSVVAVVITTAQWLVLGALQWCGPPCSSAAPVLTRRAAVVLLGRQAAKMWAQKGGKMGVVDLVHAEAIRRNIQLGQ
jgi:hypothetical protein